MFKTIVIATALAACASAALGAEKPQEKETPKMLLSVPDKRGAETARSREVLKKFYEAVARKDIEAAKQFVDDDLVFYGLFETYRGSKAYLASLTGLLGITDKLEVKAIIADGNNVAVFFDLDTKAPAKAKTLVAEWHQVKNGKIYRVRSAFDGRPFEAMFTGGEKR